MLLSIHISFLVPGPVKDSSLEFWNGNYSGLDNFLVTLWWLNCSTTHVREPGNQGLLPRDWALGPAWLFSFLLLCAVRQLRQQQSSASISRQRISSPSLAKTPPWVSSLSASTAFPECNCLPRMHCFPRMPLHWDDWWGNSTSCGSSGLCTPALVKQQNGPMFKILLKIRIWPFMKIVSFWQLILALSFLLSLSFLYNYLLEVKHFSKFVRS